MLTAERLRELLKYDRNTGVFHRRIDSGKRWKAGEVAGSIHKHNGYGINRVDGKDYFSHRLAWLYVTGEWPSRDIDHIDGNKTNNRFANLREVSEMVNAQNQKRAHSGTHSGILGVYPVGNRWKAMICIEKKPIYLGSFATPEEASAAYLAAKRLHHRGCTI